MAEAETENTVVFATAVELRAGEQAHRAALLFRAGNYPDKNVTLTPDDLDLIVRRFHAGKATGKVVPIKAEHIDTALDPLGEVVGVYHEDGQLFGMLQFSAGIVSHLEYRDSRNLSVALLVEPEAVGGGYRLKEVSVVREPRVKEARFFPSPTATAKVAHFRAAGKLTPAMESAASRLLSASSPITFADGSGGEAVLDVAGETEALLNALPVVLPRGAAVPVTPLEFANGTPALSGDAATWAERLGLDPEKVLVHQKGGR